MTCTQAAGRAVQRGAVVSEVKRQTGVGATRQVSSCSVQLEGVRGVSIWSVHAILQSLCLPHLVGAKSGLFQRALLLLPLPLCLTPTRPTCIKEQLHTTTRKPHSHHARQHRRPGCHPHALQKDRPRCRPSSGCHDAPSRICRGCRRKQDQAFPCAATRGGLIPTLAIAIHHC